MDQSSKYGLPEQDLNKVVSVLQTNPKIKKAILFGSRAKGNFTVGSDVDIALAKKHLSLDDVLEAKLEIDNLLLPWKFDLLLYNRI